MLAVLVIGCGAPGVPEVAAQGDNGKEPIKKTQPGPKLKAPESGKTTALSRPAVPVAESLLAMVRSAMAALHHANLTKNYTVLREMGSPGLQKKNTAESISKSFANLRSQQLDLSATLILTPEVTKVPEIDKSGRLSVVGFFPTKPHRTIFNLGFMPVNGRWRLSEIAVRQAKPEADSGIKEKDRSAPSPEKKSNPRVEKSK